MSSASNVLPRHVLHVLTRPGDALAADTLARLNPGPEGAARILDLTVPEPDYEALLDAIFAADSIAVW
jgi:hypothetical protein